MTKQIHYMDYYIDGRRQSNLGFYREVFGYVEIVLRNVPIQGRIERNVYFINNVNEDKIWIGEITFLDGIGQVRLKIGESLKGGMLYIPILNNSYVACEECNSVKEIVQVVAHSAEETKNRKKENKIEPVPEADKWKEIYKSYPNVHIFPQAQTVLIKPKDMLILHRDYHGLVTNSFLLHAYYNYRQLILSYEEDERYYLGVPGVYYERESQLAALYGFTRFENGESTLENGNKREVYAGCFGYYLKRVEI